MLHIRGCHPLWPCFPTHSIHTHGSAGPRSLAATRGVSVDFLSSGYLDVSVPRVCLYNPMYSDYKYLFYLIISCRRGGNNNKVSGGLPHSEIHGSKLILSSSWLIAEYHVFHRLLLPRHSPNALFALDLIQKKQDFSCGPSLLYLSKGPLIKMHTLQCLPLIRNKHCSNRITSVPVSVLDLEQNRLPGRTR